MSRAFFDQIDDELRGLVGPALRGFSSERTSRLIKVWYDDPAVHFEVQRLSGRWAPLPGACLEIGLHLESRDPDRNAGLLERLLATGQSWRPHLPDAEAGEALGPMAGRWRRLSEVRKLEGMDEDFAGEVAEAFAGYIRNLHPLLG